MPTTPYMKLYVGDYLGDTQHLSCLEHGAYMLLIMAYWQNKGPIKSDANALRRYTRTTLKEYKKWSENVLKMFDLVDGQLVHKRIEKELSERQEVSIKNRNNAIIGWSERKANAREKECERNAIPYSIVPYSIEREEKKEEKTFSVLMLWYNNHQKVTARMVNPSDADRLAAKDLGARYPVVELERAIAEYWDNWPDYWFAVKNGDMKKPRGDRRPMYIFASFSKNIEELLQSNAPPAEASPAPSLIDSVLCPVCGTNERPTVRGCCTKCGFFLDPSWINDPEIVEEQKAAWLKASANA